VAGVPGQSAAATHVRGRVARYRLVEQIGEGGMGVVYLARDETLGRNVALKLLPPTLSGNVEFRERFVRESRLAAAIDHPHIIPVFEAGEADGQLFIAMRYVRGMDLRRLLALEGPLDAQRAVEIVDQIARALDAAHREQLVHRDVKPANVMIDQSEGREHCYLTDFGLTKSTGSSSGYTETGHFVGTLNYMAPEQIEGRPVDSRADIYALGCMLYECIAGVVPFPRDSEVAMMYAHLHEPPPSLCALRPELPGSVDAVLARAMAKVPADRHATCKDVVAELRAALAGVAVLPFQPTSPSTGPRFSRPATPAPSVTVPAAAPVERSEERSLPPQPTVRQPPPSAPPSRRTRRAWGFPSYAALAAIVLILGAGGAVAVMQLTKKDEAGVSAEEQAQRRLLRRTVVLQQDLAKLAIELKKNGGEATAATKRRLADDRREAKALIAEAREQEATAGEFAIALRKANERLAKAGRAMGTVIETGRTTILETVVIYIDRSEGDVEDARATDVLPSLPTPPLSAAGGPAAVSLPDGALATIDPGPDRTVTAVSGVGDVDGDGHNDFGVIATPSDATDDPSGYVLFGGTTEDLALDDITVDEGFEIPGATGIGPAGNLNGDEKDDLAVASEQGLSQFVVFGQDIAPEVDLETIGSDSVRLRLPSMGMATMRAAGDLNDGGTDDLVIADPKAADGNGTAWVVFGESAGDGLVAVDELEPEQGIAISGGSGDVLGSDVAAAGDVNGDDVADLIVGAPGHLDDSGDPTGAAYVVYGSDQIADVDVTELDPTTGFAIVGEDVDARLGTAVEGLDDVDGDTSSDVLVTAPGSDTAYVLFGGDDLEAGPLGQLDPSRGFAIAGPAEQEAGAAGMGSSAAAAGDVNDDDFADLVIGSPAEDGPIAYVVYGGEDAGTVDLREPGDRAMAIEGSTNDPSTPVPVAGVADFDGDGVDEVLIVPNGADGPAYVVSGRP
jgi:serine/threonine protein kinase